MADSNGKLSRRISVKIFGGDNSGRPFELMVVKSEVSNFDRGIAGLQSVTFSTDEIKELASRLWTLATYADDGTKDVLNKEYVLLDETGGDQK